MRVVELPAAAVPVAVDVEPSLGDVVEVEVEVAPAGAVEPPEEAVAVCGEDGVAVEVDGVADDVWEPVAAVAAPVPAAVPLVVAVLVGVVPGGPSLSMYTMLSGSTVSDSGS